MTKFISASICALLLTVSPLLAQTDDPDFETPVTEDFQFGEVRGDGQLGVVYTYAYDLRAVDGRVALCGIYYLRELRAYQAFRRTLRNSQLLFEGEPIFEDFRFFAQARSMDGLASSTANCVLTDNRARRGNYGVHFGGGRVRM